MSPKVYLAGPEVFYPEADKVLARKRALAVEYGFTPVLGDLAALPPKPLGFGVAIFKANEIAMRAADICIANISPFRGISADVGTVWEIGFMYGLGKPCFAYTSEPSHYTDRVIGWAGVQPVRDAAGMLRLPSGVMVEEHGMTDNLMIDGSVILSGAVPSRATTPGDEDAAFIACLQAAAAKLL